MVWSAYAIVAVGTAGLAAGAGRRAGRPGGMKRLGGWAAAVRSWTPTLHASFRPPVREGPGRAPRLGRPDGKLPHCPPGRDASPMVARPRRGIRDAGRESH